MFNTKSVEYIWRKVTTDRETSLISDLQDEPAYHHTTNIYVLITFVVVLTI